MYLYIVLNLDYSKYSLRVSGIELGGLSVGLHSDSKWITQNNDYLLCT